MLFVVVVVELVYFRLVIVEPLVPVESSAQFAILRR